jgi:hypothetical protein
MSVMITRHYSLLSALLVLGGCNNDPAHLQPLVPSAIRVVSGDGQTGRLGSLLPNPIVVEVTDAGGNAAPGIGVTWSVVTGGGSIAPATASTDANGMASAAFTLGPAQGEQRAQAVASGLSGSPTVITAIAVSPPPGGGVALSVAAGGNNVPDRYSSDLWVHGNFAYTGTWGSRKQLGNVFNVWSLDPTGAPTLAGSVTVPSIGTVSDLQVSDDGQLLVVSGERGDNGGIYTYSLADPVHPAFLGSALVGSPGVHTVTLASISGRNYAFAARNPGFSGTSDDRPALVIYDVTQPDAISRVAVVPVPANYGMHDSYVRDGLAFVFAWDTGMILYDVGNGLRGGSPSHPVEVSRLVTAATSTSSPAVHNGWWFHNPVSGENRYLFIGQEGPGIIGSKSAGDIHVVDVSDLSHPAEVAFFHLDGAGTHNFWMDEGKQILYAAYYNAGVVALDVSGTLSGDLSSRVLSRLQVGGKGNTFTWGVQLANGSLYAIDMLSGLWQVKTGQ